MVKITEKYKFDSKEAVHNFTMELGCNNFFWDNFKNLLCLEPITAQENAVVVCFEHDKDFLVKLAAVRLIADYCQAVYEK